MNKKDEFWFWISKAITKPNNSASVFFFDIKDNTLFGLITENNKISPIYRNQMTQSNSKIQQTFTGKIEQFKKANDHIIELPALKFEEKKTFLSNFVLDISDLNLRERISYELNKFSENDDFNFHDNIKKIDNSLYRKFEFDRAKFISKMVREIYFPLGVSDISEVIW